MMTLQALLGIEFPIIQAPMAGVQDSRLTIAVSNAGGLGSLPCGMLSRDAMREELALIAAHTPRPYNVNFFCHPPPRPNAERVSEWQAVLAPYYREFELDLTAVPPAVVRASFSTDAADLLATFKPAVVSFHFGLPCTDS